MVTDYCYPLCALVKPFTDTSQYNFRGLWAMFWLDEPLAGKSSTNSLARLTHECYYMSHPQTTAVILGVMILINAYSKLYMHTIA